MSALNDLLNTDLAEVKTDVPLVKDGIYDLEVAEMKTVPSKDEKSENVKIVLKTTDSAPTVDGKSVNKGFPFFDTISLNQTAEYDPRQRLKRFRVGVLGPAGETGAFMPFTQYVGQIVRCKVIVRQERKDKDTGETYPPSNAIKTYGVRAS